MEITVVSAIALLIMFASGGAIVFKDIIPHIPASLFEMVLYTSYAILIKNQLIVSLPMALSYYVSMIGYALVPPTISFSISTRTSSDDEMFQPLTCMMAVMWGYFAVITGSSFLGILAVAAFCATIGFIFMVLPGLIVMGAKDGNTVKMLSNIAVFMTGFSIALVYSRHNTSYYFAPFMKGITLFGPIMLSIMNMISASRGFSKNTDQYVFNNILAAGTFGLFYFMSRNINGLEYIYNIMTMFMVIYALEKYIEFPWDGNYVYAAFIFGIFFYFFPYLIVENVNFHWF